MGILFSLLIFNVILVQINLVNGFQGIFWYISDLHLNLSHDSTALGKYGITGKDSSISLIRSSFHEMQKIYPDPRFIIVNGDNVRHWNIEDNMFKNTISNVTKELIYLFPKTLIFPSLGNHDMNPPNLLKLNSNWCQEIYDIWKLFLKDLSESEIYSFRKGCYYSQSVESTNGTVTVIVLNTMLWYNVNRFVQDLFDPLDQFLWLEQKLENSRKNDIKVFLVGHVPPGSSEYSPIKYRHLHPQYNSRLLQIMQDYADVIDVGFFAHQHTDAFKIVYDNKNNPVIPIYIAPSVSSYFLRELGSLNPSIRLYFWNGTASQSKYHQYHTYLPTSYSSETITALNWSMEYSSVDILKGLSASNLNDLLTNFSISNSLFFNTFFQYHLSGQPHFGSETCPEKSLCRCRIICGIKHIDFLNLDICLKECKPDIDYVLILLISLIIFFLLFLLFVFVVKHVRSGERRYSPVV